MKQDFPVFFFFYTAKSAYVTSIVFKFGKGGLTKKKGKERGHNTITKTNCQIKNRSKYE